MNGPEGTEGRDETQYLRVVERRIVVHFSLPPSSRILFYNTLHLSPSNSTKEPHYSFFSSKFSFDLFSSSAQDV